MRVFRKIVPLIVAISGSICCSDQSEKSSKICTKGFLNPTRTAKTDWKSSFQEKSSSSYNGDLFYVSDVFQ